MSTSDRISRRPLLSSRPLEREKHSSSPAVKIVTCQIELEKVPEFLQNPILTSLTAFPQNRDVTSDRIPQKPFLSSRPPEGENNRSQPIVKPAIYQIESGQDLKFFQNPILVALTASPQNQNATSDRISQRPLLSSRPLEREKHSSSPAVKIVTCQIELEQVPEFLQNPILTSLTAFPQNRDVTSERIPQKPFLSSRPPEGENNSSQPIVKPAIYQIESGQDLKFLQNPILAALMAPSQNQNATPDRIPRRTFLSTRPPEVKKRSSSPAVKIVNYQNETEQVPEFLQNPIWLVEKTSDREIYSNRLQIITTHTISNIPREYYRFSKNSKHLPANSKITDKISGIVYHASESDLYPFMPEMNRSILKYSKQLIKYLLRQEVLSFFH